METDTKAVVTRVLFSLFAILVPKVLSYPSLSRSTGEGRGEPWQQTCDLPNLPTLWEPGKDLEYGPSTLADSAGCNSL